MLTSFLKMTQPGFHINCLLVLWKSSESTVSPNQGTNRYGRSALLRPSDLFSWNDTVCLRYLYNQKCREKCNSEPVNQETQYFLLWKLNNCNHKPTPPSKKHCLFFLFIAARNMVIFEFESRQASCHLLLWSHLTIPFPNQINNCIEVNNYRTLFLTSFVKEWYSVSWYVCLYTTVKQTGSILSWNWVLGSYSKKKAFFHLWKLDSF